MQTLRAGLNPGDGPEQNRQGGWRPVSLHYACNFAFTTAKALAENTCGGRVIDAWSQVPENLSGTARSKLPGFEASEEQLSRFEMDLAASISKSPVLLGFCQSGISTFFARVERD